MNIVQKHKLSKCLFNGLLGGYFKWIPIEGYGIKIMSCQIKAV